MDSEMQDAEKEEQVPVAKGTPKADEDTDDVDAVSLIVHLFQLGDASPCKYLLTMHSNVCSAVYCLRSKSQP